MSSPPKRSIQGPGRFGGRIALARGLAKTKKNTTGNKIIFNMPMSPTSEPSIRHDADWQLETQAAWLFALESVSKTV